ncbi:MAG: HlyD family secretion protein [Planctomycetota bacterium]
MSHPFTRTLRSLDADRSRLGAWMAGAAVLFLALWTLWLTLARVPVFAASHQARLVTERAVYSIESPVSARVESVPAVLNQRVEAGAVLFQLDDQAVRISRDEELARAAALERRIAGTREVLAARLQAQVEARGATQAALGEFHLVRRSRELDHRYAQEELKSFELLRGSTVSELQVSKARTEVEKRQVAIQTQDASIVRLELEEKRFESERAAEIGSLRRDLAADEGELVVARAAAERLELEIERHRVRAPAAGVVGEISTLAPGAYVSAGARLGTVVAPGRIAVEALFAPSDAAGRVREGQRAELALDGFPRLEFGSFPLSVERVASEARAGSIQVELALSAPTTPTVPLEHGLPGRVRVEVERASPAVLLLRSVGHAIGRSLDSGGSQGGG